MAKKKEKQKTEPKAESKVVKEAESFASAAKEENLPQNILLMGEHTEANREIYIFQKTYKEIRRFTKNKTEIESGGILVGDTIEKFGKTSIIIRGFIEAKHSEGTPTTLKFTHETWDYVHTTIDKEYPEMKIVGWIHTHPSFGIFLSEYDKFIQSNFFNDKNQIAYVVDPIQKTEGFFFWKNEEIERCKGFYIFDDVDATIDIPQVEDDRRKEQTASLDPSSRAKDWPIWLLYASIAVLLLLDVILFGYCRGLKAQQEALKQSLTFLLSQQSFSYYQLQPNGNAKTHAEKEEPSEPVSGASFSAPETDTTSQTNATDPSAALHTLPSEQPDHE